MSDRTALNGDPKQAARKAWMSLLAKAPEAQVLALWGERPAPDHQMLRTPELGSTMVRGRIGATGNAFNLGEMTITRCSVQLSDGPVGHAYVQGRSKEKARIAALVDAMMQTDAAESIHAEILTPLAEARASAKAARAAKAAATKVDFFTMARGED
jgi:alpha-D-ribose 1-methylphosphonate 5-triphosphate synthase subunit PhnG